MVFSNEQQKNIILDSIADGVFTVDSEWRVTSFNKAAENITGIKKNEAMGRYCWEVFRASICEERCALRETMETGDPIINESIFIVSSEGEKVPVSISTALLKDHEGSVMGGVETFRDLSLVEALRKELNKQHSFQDIISKDKEMKRLFGLIEQVSESDTSVLLEGESGTGKELFAKAIHSLSNRNKCPLITINCGALPDTLLESELFGYKAGAFTDAKKDKPGRLAMARGGTLFLDEISDISPALQVRLLRVLQDKVYEPLGSTASEMADVRIIAATNKNLEEMVEKGTFRKDLYYRVNVLKLILPPLRERKGDIPLLIDHFLKKFNSLNGKNIKGLSPEVLPVIMAHDFPGNIRELENIIEYSTVICKDGLIGVEHLPDHLCKGPRFPGEGDVGKIPREGSSWNAIERNYIYDCLMRNNWNRKATAKQLGIHPTTLWRKIKNLNIEMPKKDGRSKTP